MAYVFPDRYCQCEQLLMRNSGIFFLFLASNTHFLLPKIRENSLLQNLVLYRIVNLVVASLRPVILPIKYMALLSKTMFYTYQG